MTDLLHTLPDFPTKSYTHLLPSLEKHLITTTDLLTLDSLEVAKRAQLPLLDVRRLANHVLATLQAELGLPNNSASFISAGEEQTTKAGSLRKAGQDVVSHRPSISTLSHALDTALDGGIHRGYITEITGESGAGKTQLLLTLLLSSQLPPPRGLSRASCYISTEHPLPTTRLAQLLSTHPFLANYATEEKPSLNRILTLQTPDLESQEHIITYQLPVALMRHNIGLIVIDSIAANFRAERDGTNMPSALATRSAQLVRLGAQLRELARTYDCAVVVANQVADRFPSTVPPRSHPSTHASSPHPSSSPYPLPNHQQQQQSSGVGNPLTLDSQQRFFTGWGASPTDSDNLKTPSLGLVWANQIACRIALIKERADREARAAGTEQDKAPARPSADWTPRRWRRSMRVAFSPMAAPTGEGESGVEIEVWRGGVRGVGEGSKEDGA